MLHFRQQIIQQSRRSLREEPDVHARLMSVYPQGNTIVIPHLATHFMFITACIPNSSRVVVCSATRYHVHPRVPLYRTVAHANANMGFRDCVAYL